MDETRTPGYRAVLQHLRQPWALTAQSLNLNHYSTLFRIPPEIARLKDLTNLTLTGSPVRDLSPIADLIDLEQLILDHTQINDLSPIARMTKMQDMAVSSLRDYRSVAGLSYAKTPVSLKPPFDFLVQLDQPARTVETINEVRRQQGLPEHIPEGYEPPKGIQIAGRSLDPVSGIPSAFGFAISAGQITVTSSSADTPIFPFPTNEYDHRRRLEVSRTLAADLAQELEEGRFNARPDYLECLKRYMKRLPESFGDGNILLADAEARNLRNMFAADASVLAVGLASKLKTFLEQHIGLRVYYPEIEHFYRDVQNGRLEEPLSLDAIEGVVRGVRQHTPSVFDPKVSDAVGAADERGPAISATRETSANDVDQPKPPADPLGDLNPQRAREFTIAGVVNALWKAFREGERVYQSIDAWRKAGDALRPHVRQILEWLRDFVGLAG